MDTLVNCEFCGNDSLEVVEGVYPWTVDHLACAKCDSTYCIENYSDNKAEGYGHRERLNPEAPKGDAIV